jgi:membrane protease YdiL (CAAX protease family)
MAHQQLYHETDGRARWVTSVVVEDPDRYELEEYRGIDIFEPGTQIEREVDWDTLFRVLLFTGASLGLTVIVLVVIMIPLIAARMIFVDMATFEIFYAPWAMLFLSLSELGFLVPPVLYARRRHLPLSSIGLKSPAPAKDIALGLGVGMAMLAANYAVTTAVNWLIEVLSGRQVSSSGSLFATSGYAEVVAWIVVMFVVVGFSEETVFRGFLQRRMEIYFRGRSIRYKTISIVLTSVIFAAAHLDPSGLPSLFTLSLFLGYLAQKRRYSVLGPAVAHGFNNAMVVVLTALGF